MGLVRVVEQLVFPKWLYFGGAIFIGSRHSSLVDATDRNISWDV